MTGSLSKQVFNGAIWYVAMRWAIRLLGFVSSAFLARLLVPEDFGLVALVMVLYGLISLFFEFGVNWALIQNNNAADEHFHTAWTVRLLQSIIVSLILAISSPWVASFYEDNRLTLICQIIALATLVRGFENIGTVKFQKELKFNKDFQYNVLPKALSTVFTIGFAYYYKSYMALAVGLVFSNFIVVVVSYLMVSFRPKFSLSKLAAIWGFSKWILIRSIASFINTRGDLLVLSLFTTPLKIGYYRWGTELSFMTITEIQQPFSRALLPSLSKIKDDHDKLIQSYLRALSFMTLICVPAALGFGAISQELIPIFLGGGDKWLPVVPIIEALVFLSMFSSMFGVSISLLTISGSVKYTAFANWTQVLFTLATFYPAFLMWNIEGIAYSRAFIGLVMFFLYSFLVASQCQVKVYDIGRVVIRPVVGGLLMFVLLMNFSTFITLEGWQLLLAKCVVGGFFYISVVLAMWVAFGKGQTGEAEVVNYISQKLDSL